MLTQNSQLRGRMNSYIAPKFVGRDSEQARLEQVIARLSHNQGGVVLISGESGSGKTALVEQVLSPLKSDELVIVKTGCTAFSNNNDYYLPLRQVFISLVRIQNERKSLADNMLDTLRASVTKVAPDLISHFMPGGEIMKKIGHSVIESSGLLDKLQSSKYEEIKSLENINSAKIIQQYLAFISQYTVDKHIIIFIDDIQWADNGSLEIIMELSQSIASKPVVLILTCQSEALKGKVQNPYAKLTTAINELRKHKFTYFISLDYEEVPGKQHFVNLIVDTFPNTLSIDFKNKIQQHTNGNALFVKELLHHLLEQNFIQMRDGVVELVSTLDWQKVPNKISSMINERLINLSDRELEILHIASVQGRSFYVHVLADILNLSQRELLRLLTRSIGSALGLVEEVGPQVSESHTLFEFRFCHGLVQQFLYSDLGKCEKTLLHNEIANRLEVQYCQHSPENAAELAYHFKQGQHPVKAFKYLLIAGKNNLALGAYNEAISYLKQGLAQLVKLPESEQRDEWELSTQISLGMAIRAVEGWTSKAAIIAYERAVYLGHKLGPDAPLLPVYFGLWVFHLVRLNLPKALENARALEQRAEMLGDKDTYIQSCIAMGNTLFWQGQLNEAKPYMQDVLAKADPALAKLHIEMFGQDTRVFALMFLCLISSLGQDQKQAIKERNDMLEAANEFDHSFTYAIALQGAVWCMFNLNNVNQTMMYAEQLIEHCQEHSYPFYQGVGLMFKAWALSQKNDPAEAIKYITLAASEAHLYLGGGRVFHSIIEITRAEIFWLEKQYQQGYQAIITAIGFANQCGELVYLDKLKQWQGSFEHALQNH